MCPGFQRIGAHVRPDQFERVSQYKLQHDIYHAGQKVHPSHTLHYHHGHIFCVTCGRYSLNKVSKLKVQCPGTITPAGRKTIRDIIKKDDDRQHMTVPEDIDRYLIDLNDEDIAMVYGIKSSGPSQPGQQEDGNQEDSD